MSNITYTTKIEGQTKIYNIKWPVLNTKNTKNSKNISEMRTEKTEDLRFQLKMLFLGLNWDNIDIYYLTLDPVILKLSLRYVLNMNINRIRSVVTKENQTIQANKWQYLATVCRHKIGWYDFTLIFKFTVPNDIRVERSHVPETELSKDLQGLLSNGLFSDVTMRSSDDVEFKVHKGVLASRSAVLKAHFEHNTTECNTNVIESAFDSDVLNEVLTFIYTNMAPKIDEMPGKLLVAADYYQLSRLKNLCEEALHKKLTVDNAIETLQLADLHSANTLKQLTLEFIKDVQAKLITETEGWAKFKSLELIKQIYEYVMEGEIVYVKMNKL